MASEFRIQSSRLSYKIILGGINENGEQQDIFEKTYLVDVENKERLRDIISSLKKMEKIAENIIEDESALEKIEELAKSIIEVTIGDWETIWETSNHNVFGIMGLARDITEKVKEEAGGNMKRYGFQSNTR